MAIVATILACPGYAADLCNDAHMKQMDQMIAQMTDTAKQKEATAALDQSKAAMKNGDTTACMKHMAEAHKAMGLKSRPYFVSEVGAACEIASSRGPARALPRC